MNPKELLLDVKALEEYLTRKGLLNETGHIKVEFDRTLPVYAQDPTVTLDPDTLKRDKSTPPEEDMQIGIAQPAIEDGNLYGTVLFAPEELAVFYLRHPQYRPKFIAIGALLQKDKRVEGIKIKWIETRTGN